MGIINIEGVREQIEMKKRNDILKSHPYKIWFGSDNKWHTYLPDAEKGRIPRRRNTQKEIEDLVIQYYQAEEEKPITFDDSYWKWRQSQDSGVSDNTIAKYNTDYRRFFENTDFSKKSISNITCEDIKIHINKKIRDLKLCKKACKSLCWYIRSVFTSARINKNISENPMEDITAKNFYGLCIEKERTKEQILVDDHEMQELQKRFELDHKNNPYYIVTYAVELACLTGMRVGEISALKWDCITKDRIIINKSEKYNRLTKEYFIDLTKNKKSREFPLTDEIKQLLDEVKKIEIQQGNICEWVFADDNGRVHAPVISSCSGNKCLQIGITEKGIHAYRRTINSKMRQSGVSAKTAASLLGHTDDVNEKYYTFDLSSFEEKEEIVSKINKSTVCG